MMKTTDIEKQKEIENNIMFVSTIYESFEALEETLGKLKLEAPLFITHVAKKAFAEEVLKYAKDQPSIYARPKSKATQGAGRPIMH